MFGGNRTVAVELQAKVSGFVAGFRTAGKTVGDFNRKLESGNAKHKQSLQQLSTNAGLVGVALLGLGAAAVKSFADFDSAMSKVQAATHAPQADMEQLRALALKLGADTKYSATEAAGGITELAKAGVSTKDIIGGGLAGALSLAAAGELDVADAAEVAATALTQFKLQGKDIPHVADLLAAGAGKAQGSVSDLAMGLKQSGLVASQMGLSLEDTIGTLSAFASAGLIGSDAGTSFRTMLLRLANPTGEAADLMKQLGLNAYDAQGNFVGMSSLAEQLKTKLGDMTQAQRDQTLAILFGSDAIRGANVLYAQGGAGMDKWRKKVNDAGYAAETAAIQMNNMKGDVERLTGALTTAFTNAGAGSNGPLRGLTQDATELVDKFNDLPPVVQSATLAFVGGSGLVLLGVAGLAKLAIGIGETTTALKTMGVTAATAGKALRFAGAAVAILAVAEAAKLADGYMSQFVGSQAVTNIGNMTVALARFGRTGKATGDLTKAFGRDLQGVTHRFVADGDSFAETAKRMLDSNDSLAFRIPVLGGAFRKLDEDSDKGAKSLRTTDRALAEMVKGGNAEAAARSFDRLAAAGAKEGISREKLLRLFPAYSAAVKGAAAAQKDEASAADGAATSTGEFGDSAEDTAQQVEDLKAKVDELLDELNGLSDINLDVLNSQLAVNEGLRDMTDKVKENGHSLRENTKAGDANRGMLADQIQKIKDNANAVFEKTRKDKGAEAATLAWNGTMRSNIKRLYDQAVHLGLSKEATRKLIAQVLGIPESAVTKYTAPGLDAELSKARALDGKADALDGRNVRMTWTSVFTETRIKRTIEQKIRRLPGSGFDATGGLIDLDVPGGVKYRGGKAVGGSITGPGSGTSDTAGLFALSNGEFVTNAAAASKWLPALKAINDGLSPSDLVRGSGRAFAAGSAAEGNVPVGDVHVYIGDQELRGIVRVEVRESNRTTKRRVMAGAGGTR